MATKSVKRKTAKAASAVMRDMVRRVQKLSEREGLQMQITDIRQQINLLYWMNRTPKERIVEMRRMIRQGNKLSRRWIALRASEEDAA